MSILLTMTSSSTFSQILMSVAVIHTTVTKMQFVITLMAITAAFAMMDIQEMVTMGAAMVTIKKCNIYSQMYGQAPTTMKNTMYSQ